jgi:hypothetical protein
VQSALIDAVLEYAETHQSTSERIATLLAEVCGRGEFLRRISDEEDDYDDDGSSLLRLTIDPRAASVLCTVCETGAGQDLLPISVMHPAFAFSSCVAAFKSALGSIPAGEDGAPLGDAMLFRIRRTLTCMANLQRRVPPEMYGIEHDLEWSLRFVRSITDFCVRCSDQQSRSFAWKTLEDFLSVRLSIECRVECMGALLNSCPYAHVVGLLCTLTKSHILAMRGSPNWAKWWALCKSKLLPPIFKLPQSGSEISSQRFDALMGALNLLLFLVVARIEDALLDFLKSSFLTELRMMIRDEMERQRKGPDLKEQNDLLGKLTTEQWTEDKLKEAAQRALLSLELMQSLVMRIEEHYKTIERAK